MPRKVNFQKGVICSIYIPVMYDAAISVLQQLGIYTSRSEAIRTILKNGLNNDIENLNGLTGMSKEDFQKRIQIELKKYLGEL